MSSIAVPVQVNRTTVSLALTIDGLEHADTDFCQDLAIPTSIASI